MDFDSSDVSWRSVISLLPRQREGEVGQRERERGEGEREGERGLKFELENFILQGL